MSDPRLPRLIRRDVLKGTLASLVCTNIALAQGASRRDSFIAHATRVRWLDLSQAIASQDENWSGDNFVSTLAGARTSFVDDEQASPPDQYWLRRHLELIQKYQVNPLRASRVLAYCGVTMHETWVAASNLEPQARTLAVEVALCRLSGFLFPQETTGRWPLELVIRARPLGVSGPEARAAWECGREVSGAAMHRALHDRSEPGGALVQPPPGMRLAWKATPPLWVSRPTEPLAGGWLTWQADTEKLAGEISAPPSDPLECAEAVREVLDVHRALTPGQIETALRWNLDLGTVTPAGVWLLHLLDEDQYKRCDTSERLAVAAVTTTSMLNAFIACWAVKFKWWTERPVTAIRRELDPDFMPTVVTPAFPSYVSGHASVSSAAATVMAETLPERRAQFEAMAAEAAMSRLYGGIHFRCDNDQGLVLGKLVGRAGIARCYAA